MNARHGCWTIPQLLLDLEARVKALEENLLGYVHHISFTASTVDVINLDIVNDTNKPFTSDTLMQHLLALPNNTRIMCTGRNLQDTAIVSLKRADSEISADLVDTDSNNFTSLTLYTDYIEPIRSQSN